MSKANKFLDSCIARGTTADIFAWGENQVLKLYHQGCSEDSIRQEAFHASLAHQAGMQTPEVTNIVKIGSHFGIIFARIEGSTMLDILLQHPQQATFLAHLLAQLHVKLHSHRVTNLPTNQHERLEVKISHTSYLEQKTKIAILEKLQALPKDNILCHGDFHPQNIIISNNVPVIIDWFDATLGNPLADVARTLLVLNSAVLPVSIEQKFHQQINLIRRQFATAYFEEYCKLRPIPQEQLLVWKLAIAAARLTDKLPPNEYKIITTTIEKLLSSSN